MEYALFFIAQLANDSLWKKRDADSVECTGISLGNVYRSFEGTVEQLTGELTVTFNTAHWNIDTHGLIYTDTGFLACVQAQLEQLGLPTAGVDYSEQGMQGEDYVSFDVDDAFIRAWNLTEIVIYEADEL